MKMLGYIFILFGIAFLLYVGYLFLNSRSQVVSPLPEEKGVKVIIVTPTK